MSLANPAFVASLTDAPSGFAFLDHPNRAYPMEGDTVTFSVEHNQSSVTSFQWKQADTATGTYTNVSGSDASGMTTGTLTFTNVGLTRHDKHFKCEIVHSGTTYLSDSAELFVDFGG